MYKKISNGLWRILNKVPTVCIEIGIGVLVYALYLKGTHKGIADLVDLGIRFCDENGNMIKEAYIGLYNVYCATET